MEKLHENAYYEGLEVDFRFRGNGPEFGDLFTICGYENPNFPPPGKFDFSKLAQLHFEQVDDFFGIPNHSDDGDDVTVWLFPLIGQETVFHHPGPFDGLRLSYCVLRNPLDRSKQFLRTITELADVLPVDIVYRTNSGGLDQVEKDIASVAEHWSSKGIIVGSDAALQVEI